MDDKVQVARAHALGQTTHTAGWQLVMESGQALVAEWISEAVDYPDETGQLLKLRKAQAAREFFTELKRRLYLIENFQEEPSSFLAPLTETQV